ncbi:hypothetical protein LWI28_022701 [Acer negundo]|uniref:Uncharacterized protein n=1 Tax=Acer negundo TaxID=4023 RepID=A0AAD5P4U8_ACENE|nr:hypothetical protein LWI28_005704 [Acer negundo]KAI9198827.1 hypothetical protein LWI28_022701 [Acer negundo]
MYFGTYPEFQPQQLLFGAGDAELLLLRLWMAKGNPLLWCGKLLLQFRNGKNGIEGTASNVIDPTLRDEMMKCILIGLLCVQFLRISLSRKPSFFMQNSVILETSSSQ